MPIDFGPANPTRTSRTAYENPPKHPGMEGAVGHADVVELSDVLDPEVAPVVV
ncbi:MAG: hypothetical protein Q8O40_09805 [Chloroflexota bacterium]|nr:hypothetical protein [Chloroflexota bacterium]